MGYRYAITYGKPSEYLMGLKPEERAKAFEKHKEKAAKYGVKVLFYGHPWGTSESIVVVYDSGESIDNYSKFVSSPETYEDIPYTEGRTNLVIELMWT